MLDGCRQRRARWLLGAIGLAVAAVVIATGCDGRSDGLAGLRDSAVEILDAADLRVQRQPQVQRSKDVAYITADGTLMGDLAGVVAEATRALEDGAWDVRASEPVRGVAVRADLPTG